MRRATYSFVVPLVVGILLVVFPVTPAQAQTSLNVPSYVNLQMVSGIIADRVFLALGGDLESHGDDNPRQGFPGAATDFGPNVWVSNANPTRAIPDNEPSIAINPNNRHNLVVGAHHTAGVSQTNELGVPDSLAVNECAIYVSNDAGTTWTFAGFTPLAQPEDFCSDPVITSNQAGDFLYSYLSVRDDVSTTDLTVIRSRDGGKTWSAPIIAARGVPPGGVDETFPDKEWIAGDFHPTSKFKGNVYMSYTDFQDDRCVIGFVRSTDGGTTWSAPRTVSENLQFNCFLFLSTSGGVRTRVFQGSNVAVAPSGRVYVAYFDSRGPPGTGPKHSSESWLTGFFDIQVVFSADGGLSWSGPYTAFTGKELDTLCPSEGIGVPPSVGLLPGCMPPTRFRGWSTMFPQIAIARDGTVFIVVGADPDDGNVHEPATFGVGVVDADDGPDDASIFMVRSTDGISWSTPVTVNDDGGFHDQFFGAAGAGIAANDKDNTVHFTWADRRDDPLDISYHIYYQAFNSDGTRIGSNMRVSEVMANPNTQNRGRFIGDYFHVAVGDVSVHPVWVDTRREATTQTGIQTPNQDIFTARGTAAKPNA